MSSIPSTKHKYQPRTHGDIDDDLLRHIAASVLLQAVTDWVNLIRLEDKKAKGVTGIQLRDFRQRTTGGANFIEIRAFLRSDYGDTLCSIVGIGAEIILERLESWLAAYREQGTIPVGVIPTKLIQKGRTR